jgi:hypothetical protein
MPHICAMSAYRNHRSLDRVCTFPGCAGAGTRRRHGVRRRAADVCDRPGFDERTAAVMIAALSLGLSPLMVG